MILSVESTFDLDIWPWFMFPGGRIHFWPLTSLSTFNFWPWPMTSSHFISCICSYFLLWQVPVKMTGCWRWSSLWELCAMMMPVPRCWLKQTSYSHWLNCLMVNIILIYWNKNQLFLAIYFFNFGHLYWKKSLGFLVHLYSLHHGDHPLLILILIIHISQKLNYSITKIIHI